MQAINLLPKDAERARRTTPDPALLIGVAGFAIVVASIFSMFISASQNLQDKREDYDGYRSELATLDRINPPPKVLPIQQTMAGEREARIRAVAGALSYRVPWDYVLGQISLSLPSGVKLTSLKATAPLTPNPQTESSTLGEIELKGWTYAQESVGVLLTRLRVLPSLVRSSVKLVSINKTGGASNDGGGENERAGSSAYYEFSIIARVRTPGAAAS